MRRRLLMASLAAAALPRAVHAAGPLRQPWPAGRATPALQLPLLGPADAAAPAPPATWTLASVRGRPVLLNFWASWCEPCRAEMPSLAALATEATADGLLVLTVNFKEGEAAIRRFQATTALALPVLRDADGAAAKAFGVRVYPSTVAIDRAGRARFTVVGEADWQSPLVGGWLAPLRDPTPQPATRR